MGGKGSGGWNKGLKFLHLGSFKKGQHHKTEFKKGHLVPAEWRKKLRLFRKDKENLSVTASNKHRKGEIRSEETREKMSQVKIGKPNFCIRKENHPNWKGGITPLNQQIRHSLEYKIWRKAVFTRDNFICQFCGKYGGQLNADHIKSFAIYPELRLDISNGRTLCIPCHKATDTYGNKCNKRKSPLNLAG